MSTKPRVQPEITLQSDGVASVWLYRVGAIGLLLLAVLVGVRMTILPPIGSPSPTQPALAPIDINTATEAELSALPRIGPALARRIVEDRTVSGAYSSIDDLDRVPGIGPRTIEAIRPHATARSPG